GASGASLAARQASHHRADRRCHQAAPSRRRSRICERETFRRRDYLSGGAVCATCSGRLRLSLLPGGNSCRLHHVVRPASILAAWWQGRGFALRAFRWGAESARRTPPPMLDEPANPRATAEVAILAGGCFWGVQGVFQHVAGVTSAISGYTGGTA